MKIQVKKSPLQRICERFAYIYAQGTLDGHEGRERPHPEWIIEEFVAYREGFYYGIMARKSFYD